MSELTKPPFVLDIHINVTESEPQKAVENLSKIINGIKKEHGGNHTLRFSANINVQSLKSIL